MRLARLGPEMIPIKQFPLLNIGRKAPVAGASPSGRTGGQVQSAGKVLYYKATAGTLVLNDDAAKAKASVFYVAYEKEDKPHATTRPSESRPADTKPDDAHDSSEGAEPKRQRSQRPLT